MQKFLFIALICFFHVQGKAQSLDSNSVDSAQENKVQQKTPVLTVFLHEDSSLFKPNHYSHIDTTLPNLDIVDEYQSGNKVLWRINNYGSAYYNMAFDPFRKIGYNLGFVNHEPHFYKAEDLRYYDSYRPYTQFKYVQGDGELQVLGIKHSQTINANNNIGVLYNSTRSAGFYSNEENNSTRLGVNYRYTAPSNKYQVLAYAIWNTLRNQENGGIQNLQRFPNLAEIQRLSQPSVLEDGANFFLRNMEIGLRQTRYFGKVDSVFLRDSSKLGQVLPRTYVSHKLSFKRNRNRFRSDTNSAVFPNNYARFDRYFQVLENQELSNEIALGWFFNKKEVLRKDSQAIAKPYPEKVLYVGADFRFGRNSFYGLERITFRTPDDLPFQFGYANLHLFGNLSTKLTAYTHLKARAEYVAIGSQFSDYHLQARLQQTLFKHVKLIPILNTQAISPTMLQRTYVSSYARWNNDFRKEFYNELGAELKYRENTTFKTLVRRADNYVFFNEEMQPTQAETGINFLQLQLQKNLHIGHFHFENLLQWQQINEDAAYKAPTWMLRLHYYFKTAIFKKRLNMQLGARLNYFSAFQGMVYQPGIGQFLIVETAPEVGNYPVLDMYLSINVKRWNGFIKFNHLNQGLNGFDYEMLPGYPMMPRAIRMGVAWRFYD